MESLSFSLSLSALEIALRLERTYRSFLLQQPTHSGQMRSVQAHPTNSSVIFIAFGGAGDILSAVTWMEERRGRTSRELHPRQIGPGKNALLPDQHLQRAGVNAPGPPSRYDEPGRRSVTWPPTTPRTIKRLLFTANEAKNCRPPPDFPITRLPAPPPS